jgi:hypothetical protein
LINLHPSVKRFYFLTITILLASPGLAQAQQKKDESKPLVYADLNKGSEQLVRDARRVYADKFRFFEAKQKQGFAPGGLKGFFTSTMRFRDPRSMRVLEIPGKVSYAVVVTPDGKVIEPRILHSTDPVVAKYVVEKVRSERYFPARWQGTPVYSLHVEEWKFGGSPEQNRLYRDGLGIQGQHDRAPLESPRALGPR